MLEITPGLRAVEIDAPFHVSRHTTHGKGVVRSVEPLILTSPAPPWSYVASFPAEHVPIARAEGPPQFGWITRVHAELLEGDAMFAHATANRKELAGEAALGAVGSPVDLVIGSLERWPVLLMRVGRRGGGVTTVRVDRFQCFALFDEDADPWQMPAGVRLAPMRDWNHFYGSPDHLSGRVRQMRFQRLEAPRPMGWLLGLDITITPGDQISQAIYASGLYEPCTMTVLRHLLIEGDVFVDVGANIGAFSLVASRWVGRSGRVVSLEPSSRECARLRHNVAINRLENVSVHELAAGAEPSSGILRVAGGPHTGLNTLEAAFMYSGVSEDHVETVAIVTLDDLLAGEQINRVSVLKIDVEGGEHRVIAGARRTIEHSRPVVLLEVAGPSLAPDHAGRQEIERFLGGLGYRFAAIDAHTASIVAVGDLACEAENLVAAQPDALDRLMRAMASV